MMKKRAFLLLEVLFLIAVLVFMVNFFNFQRKNYDYLNFKEEKLKFLITVKRAVNFFINGTSEYFNNDEGDFTTVINGKNFKVNWKVLEKDNNYRKILFFEGKNQKEVIVSTR